MVVIGPGVVKSLEPTLRNCSGAACAQPLINQGLRMAHKFEKIQSILLPFWVWMWFLTAGPVASFPMIFSELPERKNCLIFLQEA